MDKLVTIECCECAYTIHVTAELKQRLQDNGKLFYCINGHGQSYSKPTVSILREKVAARDKEINDLKIKLEQAQKPTIKKRGRPKKK